MSGRFFLDTNIFVYSFDANTPAKSRRAQELIRRAVATRKGIISYQVVQEFFNVALRRFVQPMTAAEAEEFLATVFSPMLVVHSSQALYSEALRLNARFKLAWYDSLIVAAALESESSILYSEDFQAGQRFSTLTIENPFV